MEIKEFIIHQIDKLAHKDPKVQLRETQLKVADERVQKFAKVAIEVFKANEEKPSSVFADFNEDAANYPFSDWCKRYFCKTTNFVKFTKDATNRLANCMKAQQASTGGYVVFATFEADGEIKLLVCMLHSQDGLSITSKLEFEDVTHLELKHIDKAALITAPTDGVFGDKPLTYAGFRKEMSQYFQEFLGPDAFRNPSKDSSGLIDKLEDYARDNNFDEARLDGLRVSVRKYAQSTARNCGPAAAGPAERARAAARSQERHRPAPKEAGCSTATKKSLDHGMIPPLILTASRTRGPARKPAAKPNPPCLFPK